MFSIRALIVTAGLLLLSPAACRAEGPNIFSRMGNGAKNFFVKTGEFLSPWKSEPESRQSVTGTRRIERPGQAQQEKSFFSGWFAKEEPQQPLTVSEWLDLPRPE